ncbi:MAG: type IV secretion protein Rhs, partial [Nitrosarchaeum sp.]|nr:type IV secretion protein Rhs [Nitrosarchaeum sp.]
TYGTDPLNPDTDAGGVSDGQEVNVDGTNPLDALDDLVIITP